jgi:hypothetical protein
MVLKNAQLSYAIMRFCYTKKMVVVECSPNKREALSSIPSTAQKKKRKKERKSYNWPDLYSNAFSREKCLFICSFFISFVNKDFQSTGGL